MNLWLRFIWLLLTMKFRPKVEPFGTSTLRMTVMPNDLDVNMHVNNGRYFTLADLGRLDFTARTGVLRVALRKRAAPIVGDAMAKFRKDLKPFQRFELQTRVLGWDDKWAFMEHRFVRHGRVLGVVVMRGVFRARDGLLKPAELLSALGVDLVSPPLPAWVQQWHQACEAMGDVLRLEERGAA
jgi:acyl-CoA thioesterase FadM